MYASTFFTAAPLCSAEQHWYNFWAQQNASKHILYTRIVCVHLNEINLALKIWCTCPEYFSQICVTKGKLIEKSLSVSCGELRCSCFLLTQFCCRDDYYIFSLLEIISRDSKSCDKYDSSYERYKKM
ncbi:unnamed protein product [Ceratitis capitata]|uniref:(Mediterranean fruit fly) hypothetical protein n=1 Tax=Ceratitis capitata TaxID=7213 RepID=A0A811VC24_CERCA|nr:unnamed protein product [Ceratitis capitata]